jgi:predicted glutamine amidotransferase
MSSHVPTSVRLSLGILARHGSTSRRLGDGWGVAFHDGRDARVFREPEPAGNSPWLPFLDQRPLGGRVVLAHVRHAMQGGIALSNTQPFQRELGGRVHLFAHNGYFSGIEQYLDPRARFRPIGDTDSEIAFCALLARVAPLWDAGMPSVANRAGVVAALAAELRVMGPANFLYTDGDLLIAHADRRTQPDGQIVPPGMVMLGRSCPIDRDTLPAAGVDIAPGPQSLMLFASVPLTDENWRPLPQGSLTVVQGGELVSVS